MRQREGVDYGETARYGAFAAAVARYVPRVAVASVALVENLVVLELDVAEKDAVDKFYNLIELIDGMDYLLYAAGCGWYNPALDAERDEQTLQSSRRATIPTRQPRRAKSVATRMPMPEDAPMIIIFFIVLIV